MEKLLFGWNWYTSNKLEALVPEKCGKWMYFFENREQAEKMCRKAIAEEVVRCAKHTSAKTGVACFYLNGDDTEGHKRVISFFLENGLIRRTKKGKLFNISFKYDEQTRKGLYGENFEPEIRLDHYINLSTGEWIA